MLFPVEMILLWLIWGVVAHFAARLLGGKALVPLFGSAFAFTVMVAVLLGAD